MVWYGLYPYVLVDSRVLSLIDFGAYELMLKNIGYQRIETEWRIYAPVN